MMSLFSKVKIWRDRTDRSASAQMAVDEAMLRNFNEDSSESAELRFYLLPKAAITLGFFMPYDKALVLPNARFESENADYSIVRRLTGGGIVYHGNDITFSLVVGKKHRLSAFSAAERYRAIHEALRDSLIDCQIYPEAELIPVSSEDSKRGDLACFSKPVGWDVLSHKTGPKIAGGAQRRVAGAWLHQGTVQVSAGRSVSADWTDIFARKLGSTQDWSGTPEIEIESKSLETTRYSTREWNERG